MLNAMALETTERVRKDRDPMQASDGKPPAYAIFEGGGARGITHVGALKALRIIEMESPLRTAEFGCSRHRATLAYAAGYDRTSACLATWSLEQEQIQKLLDEALPEVERLMIECRQARGDLWVPRLRISIVDPTPSGAFKVAASAGMTADADDRMEYDPRNAAAPAAYLGKIATNVSYVRSTPWIGEIMTKYERALLPGSRQWVISVPVSRLVDGGIPSDLAARDVIRVLCIDSDDDLRPDFADPKFMNWLGEETVLFISSSGDRP